MQPHMRNPFTMQGSTSLGSGKWSVDIFGRLLFCLPHFHSALEGTSENSDGYWETAESERVQRLETKGPN